MILNLTKNCQIASQSKTYKTVLSLARGLMFRKPLQDSEALILDMGGETSGSIHTFFVFFPIDVIWINRNLEVVDLQENVKPFVPWLYPKKRSRYVIELPKGAIKISGTEVGDKIVI